MNNPTIETRFERSLRYYRNEVVRYVDPLDNKSITAEEHNLLLTQFHPFSTMNIILQLLWETGGRILEIVELQKERFNKDYTEVRIHIKKSKKKIINGVTYQDIETRVCPLSHHLSEKIKLYCETSNLPYGYLFPSKSKKRLHMKPTSVNKNIDSVRDILGGRFIKRDSETGHHDIAPHSYRRAWITRYDEQHTGVSPFETSRAIGHKDPRTTMKYRQYTDKLHDRIKNFVESNSVHTVEVDKERSQDLLKEGDLAVA